MSVIKNVKLFFVRLNFIIKLVWEAKPSAFVLLIFLILITGFEPVAMIYVNKQIIKTVSDSIILKTYMKNWNQLLISLIAMLAILMINKIATSLKNLSNSIISNELTKNIQLKLMDKAAAVDLASFDDMRFFNIIEQSGREANNRPVRLINSIMEIFTSLISFISLFTVMASFNIYIALLISVSYIPICYLSFILKDKGFLLSKNQTLNRRIMAYFSSLFINKEIIMDIKLFNLKGYFQKKYTDAYDKNYEYLMKYQKFTMFWIITSGFATLISTFIAYIVVGLRTLKGIIGIDQFVLYTATATSMGGHLISTINNIADLYEGSLFIDNLKMFLDYPVEINKEYGISPNKGVNHSIEFKNVSFKYPNSERFVLKDISFIINPGEIVSFAGINGAGKTTIIKLILRLYDVSEGEILFDGKNIKLYNVIELYNTFGVLSQTISKFSMTAAENIGLSDFSQIKNTQKLKEAASILGAHEFIEKFKNKYNNMLTKQFDNEGEELSLGQWQKIAVARVFFTEADTYIFDEPSSSMDARSEYELFKVLENNRGNKTTIFVSHRLSSSLICDKIIFIANGEIAEIGSHEELIEKNGEYATLFNLQAERYVAKEKK